METFRHRKNLNRFVLVRYREQGKPEELFVSDVLAPGGIPALSLD